MKEVIVLGIQFLFLKDTKNAIKRHLSMEKSINSAYNYKIIFLRVEQKLFEHMPKYTGEKSIPHVRLDSLLQLEFRPEKIGFFSIPLTFLEMVLYSLTLLNRGPQ